MLFLIIFTDKPNDNTVITKVKYILSCISQGSKHGGFSFSQDYQQLFWAKYGRSKIQPNDQTTRQFSYILFKYLYFIYKDYIFIKGLLNMLVLRMLGFQIKKIKAAIVNLSNRLFNF